MAQVVSLGMKLGALYLYSIGFVGAGQALYAASVGIDVVEAREQKRKARNRARDAYNSSLKDRLEMVDITPDHPRTIALGRVRAVEGVRRRWVSGANDEKLTMIVSLAGHEIDAIETIYFDDVAVTLDGSGYVQTAPYLKASTETPASETVALDGSGAGSLTLPFTPISGTVSASWSTGVGDGQESGTVTVDSVVGSLVTLSAGRAGATAYVGYSYSLGTPTARVRSYLGASGQNIGAALAAEYPGKITATDAFSGMAALVVDIDYDPDVYPQGRPNVSAVFRGAKVYDPRLDTTAGGSGSQRLATPSTWAWRETPALLADHYARHANGWGLSTAEIMPAAAVATEADFCDTSTVFTLRAVDNTTSTVTLPRYRCGIVISTAGDPKAAMEDILESMAGRAGWAGGVWQFRAGRMPASVADMGPSWLARRLQEDGTPEPGPTLSFTNGVPRETKVNRVTGSCVDPAQRYQVLPFPAVEDAVLIASEGADYPLEVEYQGVNHIAHAQHLASVTIRRNQAALRLQAECNLHAYRLELFDVVSLTLPQYGITAKTMEVVGWRWHPTEGVSLSQSEITDAIFTVDAELAGRDPAPNTSLPSPWDVETLAGLAVTSGISALGDGSIITRVRVAWTAAASQSVRAGGRVDVQFRQAADTEWQTWEEAGANVSALIPGLRGGMFYVFRARFVSASPLRVRGGWGAYVLHQVGVAPSATVVQIQSVSGNHLVATTGGMIGTFPNISIGNACVVEINITARVTVTNNAVSEAFTLFASFSGSGTFYGDSQPKFQCLTTAGTGAVISVSHQVTLLTTGVGPWTLTPYFQGPGSANTYDIDDFMTRVTEILR
jgi:hypothetical protein